LRKSLIYKRLFRLEKRDAVGGVGDGAKSDG